jgi:hypothetical protein
MTTPHKYADILRAIADGKRIQCYLHRKQRWMDTEEHSVFNAIMLGDDNSLALQPSDYRVKPATITINGIECPAPETTPPFDKCCVVINVINSPDQHWTKQLKLPYTNPKDAEQVFAALAAAVKPIRT